MLVGLGTDDWNPNLDIPQCNYLSVDDVAAYGHSVLHEQPAQMVRSVCDRVGARLIRVPCAETSCRIALTEQVFAHQLRPDEIVKAKDLEWHQSLRRDRRTCRHQSPQGPRL